MPENASTLAEQLHRELEKTPLPNSLSLDPEVQADARRWGVKQTVECLAHYGCTPSVLRALAGVES